MAPKSLGKAVRIHSKVHAPLAVQRAAQKRLLFRIGLGEKSARRLSICWRDGRDARSSTQTPFHEILEVSYDEASRSSLAPASVCPSHHVRGELSEGDVHEHGLHAQRSGGRGEL